MVKEVDISLDFSIRQLMADFNFIRWKKPSDAARSSGAREKVRSGAAPQPKIRSFFPEYCGQGFSTLAVRVCVLVSIRLRVLPSESV